MPPFTRIGHEFLLVIIPPKYSVRLVTSSFIYVAAEWQAEWKDALIVTLHDARIRDAQGRAFVTAMRDAPCSPRIVIPNETLMTVIGEKQGYHVPLPLAHSLYFALK